MGGNSKNSNPKFTRERQIFHYTFLFDAYVSAGIGTLLNRARKKLDGTYEETRQQINLRRKENRKKCHEEDSEIQHKLKSREQRLSEMREYNKRYYQAYREEILSRRKSKKNVPKV